MALFGLTKQERSWVLYDVGNSAFTLLISTIIPIYFNDLAGRAGISEVDYLAYCRTGIIGRRGLGLCRDGRVAYPCAVDAAPWQPS